MLSTLTYILFIVFFAYCSLCVGYLFLFSFSGRFFFRKRFYDDTKPKNKIAVLVPAYKEDGIILSTANHLLKSNYPKEFYDVFIIADSFQSSTINALKRLPVNVWEVSFDKSTKTKSLNEAFRKIDQAYNIVLICDADNILSKNFLSLINSAFEKGEKAVQGRRVAKNLDSAFAILDACSEGINNTIFRKGANALGLSSAVIGSGMAFQYNHLKKIMSEIRAVGGFDKILQLKMVEERIKIQYLEDALIFDEKVDSSDTFKQQRKRWVSSQFIYLKQFFIPAIKQVFKGNLSYFNLAIANNLVLPRAYLLAILPMLIVISFFISRLWIMVSAGLFFIYIISLAIALPRELVNRNLWLAILKLPKAILMMFGALFQIRKSNKTFIHTVHTKTEVSNTLFKDHVN